MNIDLAGRTALVTGSTGGIDLAIARQLAASDAAATVNDRNQERADQAIGLPRGLAKPMAGTNATVNAVPPGPTLSDGVKQVLEGMKKPGGTVEQAGHGYVGASRPTSILKRTTGVDEIANLVTYVASPLSSAIAAATLRAGSGIVEFIG